MSLSFNREVALPSGRFLELSFGRARIKSFPPRFSLTFLSCSAHYFHATIILHKLRDRPSQPRLSSRSSLIGCFPACVRSTIPRHTRHRIPADHVSHLGLHHCGGYYQSGRYTSTWGPPPYGRSCPGTRPTCIDFGFPREDVASISMSQPHPITPRFASSHSAYGRDVNG